MKTFATGRTAYSMLSRRDFPPPVLSTKADKTDNSILLVVPTKGALLAAHSQKTNRSFSLKTVSFLLINYGINPPKNLKLLSKKDRKIRIHLFRIHEIQVST